jgi:hypothetical protein
MTRILHAFVFIFLLNIPLHAQFNLVWSAGMGGAGIDVGTHVFTDAAGNIYTAGYFDSSADFDPGPGVVTLTTAGIEDVYITKQNSSGTLLWAKAFGGSNTDIPAGIGVDNAGNVYVSGFYGGAIDLDPSAATYSFFVGSIEVFVSKFDANGNFVWGASMGSGANDKAFAMTVDGAGNVYTTGSFEGMMDFDPGAGTYQITPFGSGGTDVFVSKLNTNGVFAWAVNLGGIGSEVGYGICTDALSNVYVTGYFEDVADLDPGAGTFTLQSAGVEDAFVCKLDPNGSFIWAKQFGATGVQNGYGLVTDGANLYITGDFQNTVDFDPGVGTFNMSSTGAFYSSYAVKLTNAGNFVWAKSITGNNDVIGNEIRVNATGVYWAGFNKGTADLDPGTGTNNSISATGYDSFLTVLDAGGNYVAAESFPYEWNSFVLGSGSTIVSTGKFTLSRDFDPSAATSSMTSLGMADIAVVKLSMSLVSVQQNSNESEEISLYPNPNAGNFEFNAPLGSQVKIVNSIGQTVSEFPVTNGTQPVNLNNCKAGIYVVMINTNGKQTSKKFVVIGR